MAEIIWRTVVKEFIIVFVCHSIYRYNNLIVKYVMDCMGLYSSQLP